MSRYLGEKAHFLTEEGKCSRLVCVCVSLYALASFPETRIWGSDSFIIS